MKTQEIGQSGMIASRVALGVMRMDALDAADAARTVAVAHDSGIDYFDTADIYGFHDRSSAVNPTSSDVLPPDDVPQMPRRSGSTCH